LRVVLDTSVLAAAFLKQGGVNDQVLKQGGKSYELYLSEAILEELRRVLLTYPRLRRRYPYSDEDVEEFIEGLRKVSYVISSWPELRVIAEDPKDDMVLACALEVGADYIVSKDEHLTGLKEYRDIKILSTDKFLKLLKRNRR
jgi:putative PIN family toxin of toxin-antitoxin system